MLIVFCCLVKEKLKNKVPLQTVCCAIQEPAYDSVNCSVSRRWFWSMLRYYRCMIDCRHFKRLNWGSQFPLSCLQSYWGWGGAEIMMRLPVKYSYLVSVFIEASINLTTFWNIEDAKKIKNYQRLYRKYWFDFCKAFKKSIHLVTLSL